MFDPTAALGVTRNEDRCEATLDQDRLDISEKVRTSVLPWRGQFSPQLVDYLIETHAPKARMIVDPFCGSGTVLYEAAAHRIGAYAVDINPAAVCLAQFSRICLVPKRERFSIIEELRSLSSSIFFEQDEICVDDAAIILQRAILSDVAQTVARAALLVGFGNQRTAPTAKLFKALRGIEGTLLSAPYTSSEISSDIGDARDLAIEDSFADYMVTSPPYINVFNYHQNYRPLTESFGYRPLPMARAEIGANRKYRQNRYMTVVQYAIDMAEFLTEARRVIKENGRLTIVLGRESNVRGVPFKNGEIIAAIACEGLGWRLHSWNERKFMNRFGETIFEDVLTMTLPSAHYEDAASIGRLVGAQALSVAMVNAPTERRNEIEEALAAAPSIPPSPYVLKEKQHG